MSSRFNSPKARHKTPPVCYSKRTVHSPIGPPPPIPPAPPILFASVDFRNNAEGADRDYDSNKMQLIETTQINAWYTVYFREPTVLAALYISWDEPNLELLWSVSTIPDWTLPINWINFVEDQQNPFSLTDQETFTLDQEGPLRKPPIFAGDFQNMQNNLNPFFTPIMIAPETPGVDHARVRVWA